MWSKHRGVEGRRIGESSHPIYHLFYWFGWEQLRHRRRIYDDDPSQTILCVPQSNLANHSALLMLLLAVSHVWHTYLFSGSIADTLKGWQKFNICQVVVVTHYQFPITLNFILPTRGPLTATPTLIKAEDTGQKKFMIFFKTCSIFGKTHLVCD